MATSTTAKMSYDLIQIILISFVLIVGVIHLILDQFTNPKSDIVLDSIGASGSYAERWRGEYVYQLYYSANNRGEDNGYVTSASIERIDFFNEEASDEESLYIDDLAERIYGDEVYPFVILQREREGEERNERGELPIPKAEVVEILVVLRIFAWDVGRLAKEYDKTRVVLKFTIVDNEQRYSQMTESHILDTRKLTNRVQ